MKIPPWLRNSISAGPVIGFYYGAIGSWFSPETEAIGNLPISPGILQTVYLAAAISGTLILICFNWQWIKGRFSARRRAQEAEIENEIDNFRQLIPELRATRDLIRSCWMSREPLYSVQSEMTSIYLKLNHLGLPCPVMLDNCSEYDLETRNALGRWITFLDVLIPLADIGDLELARRIVMDDMEVKFAP